MVKSCKSCASVAKTPPIKFNPWPKTDKPWYHLHIDYVSLIKETYFFVIVDSFMNWPKIFKSKTSKTIIKVLQELFARFGLPETIVSNNGTPFTSKEFENFCKFLLKNHLNSAPYHPRSNRWKYLSMYLKEQLKRQMGSKLKMRNYKNSYPFIK